MSNKIDNTLALIKATIHHIEIMARQGIRKYRIKNPRAKLCFVLGVAVGAIKQLDPDKMTVKVRKREFLIIANIDGCELRLSYNVDRGTILTITHCPDPELE